MQIHAMAARETGAALESWTYDAATPGPWDCLIRVLACGICHSDIHMVDDDWSISSYPLVPGHEVVGEVLEVGSHVTHLKPGDRIGVGWQRSSCMVCGDCFDGNENLCNESSGVIVGSHGGFADHLVMDSRFCFHLPKGIATDVAGPLMCGGITVYSALRCAGLSSGLDVGVIGVGGLGHMAVQFAARLGNCVTVFTTSDDKARFAAELGAHEAVVLRDGVVPESLSRPLDILINTVPHHLDWNAYLNLLGSDGVQTFVGVPGGPFTIDLNRLLFKRRSITASPIGGRAMMRDMLGTADRFGIAPIIEKFALADCNDAVSRLRENRVRYRAVLVP